MQIPPGPFSPTRALLREVTLASERTTPAHALVCRLRGDWPRSLRSGSEDWQDALAFCGRTFAFRYLGAMN
jgi:hypothetical protein